MNSSPPSFASKALRLLALCAPFAISSYASAASITWSAQAVSNTDLAQPADVSAVQTAGTLVAAFKVGGPAATVNGVPFATGTGSGTINTAACDWSVPGVSWGNDSTGFYNTSGSAPLGNDANAWLHSGKWHGSGTARLNMKGLISGKQYQVQLFFADIRSTQHGRTVSVDGGATKYQYAFSPSGGPYGYLALTGNFIANGSTQSVDMNSYNGGTIAGTQLNAFQIRDLGVPTTVQAPTFSLAAGTYIGAQTVTLNCATSGATIYYTTDGNPPTSTSSSGTSGLTVNIPAGATTTLQAFATNPGTTDSTVSSASYTTLVPSSGVWTNPEGGSWSTAANWQANAIPFGGTADFSTLALPADAIVTLDGPQTIGNLIFGDTSSNHDWQFNSGSTGPLTLGTGNVTPTVTVNNRTATISAVVAGTRGLTKSGSGTLALTGTNTYTGGTNINQGALKLDLSGRSGNFDLGAIAVGSSGNLELYNTHTSVDAAGTATVNGGIVLSGNGIFNKTGAGYLDFFGTSTSIKNFTGQINVMGGALASNNSDWGSSAGQMSVFVNSGAYLDLRVGNVVIDKLTGTGHVGTTWSSTGKILRIGNNDGSSTFDGVIENTITGSSFTNFTGGGNVGLTKNGSGTQILTGANTYTFTTNISGGTLQLGDGGTSGSLATGSMIVNNGTLAFNRSDSISQGTHFSDNTISGSGGLTQMGPGSLTLTTNHSYTGTTAVTGGELAIALAPGTKWNVAKLDLANATTLSLHNFDSSSGTASADVSQSLTTTGTVTVKVSGHFTVGSFPLIWYPVGSSIGGAGFGALVLGALPAGVSATLVHDPDNGTINLNVTAVQSDPFQDWITTHYPSLSGNNALPGADPDGDRMSNLGEFAFNGDPTNGTNNGLIAVKSVDTNANGNKELTLTLAVRTGAAFTGSPSPSATMDGVSYRIEGSLNLVDAFASAVSEVLPALTPTQTGLPDISGSGWEYHSFRLNTSEGLTGKGFLRAKAATP